MTKNKAKVEQIFALLSKNNQSPTTELIYSSGFELLIAVVLSAQATDISVNKVTNVLFKIANTPQSIYALGVDGLENYIKSIGLYKTKAKNIISLCRDLIDKYSGVVPCDFDELISLAGVGQKTANVILNTLFGKPTIAVDTHVFRVSNRLGIALGKTPVIVESKLNKIVPDCYKVNAHHWLILHGRYVCKARNPECDKCTLKEYCNYYKEIQ